MKYKTLIILAAIVSITILEGIALLKGIDGALFMSSLALVGGLAGYELKDMKDKILAIKLGR